MSKLFLSHSSRNNAKALAIKSWLADINPITLSPYHPITQALTRRIAKLNKIPAEAKPMIEYLVKQRLLATDTDIHHETTIESLQSASRDWEAMSRFLGLIRRFSSSSL